MWGCKMDMVQGWGGRRKRPLNLPIRSLEPVEAWIHSWTRGDGASTSRGSLRELQIIKMTFVSGLFSIRSCLFTLRIFFRVVKQHCLGWRTLFKFNSQPQALMWNSECNHISQMVKKMDNWLCFQMKLSTYNCLSLSDSRACENELPRKSAG